MAVGIVAGAGAKGPCTPNFTLSWQEPQASRLRAVFQLSPCGVSGSAPSWHLVQLRMSCGKTIVEKSCFVLLKPQMAYSPPAATLGRSSPRWILWIITLKSTAPLLRTAAVCRSGFVSFAGFSLLGSTEPGLWQVTQYFTSMRASCAWIRSWHSLHFAVLTISRRWVTGDPFGTKSNTAFAAGTPPRVCMPTRCVRFGW